MGVLLMGLASLACTEPCGCLMLMATLLVALAHGATRRESRRTQLRVPRRVSLIVHHGSVVTHVVAHEVAVRGRPSRHHLHVRHQRRSVVLEVAWMLDGARVVRRPTLIVRLMNKLLLRSTRHVMVVMDVHGRVNHFCIRLEELGRSRRHSNVHRRSEVMVMALLTTIVALVVKIARIYGVPGSSALMYVHGFKF